MIFQITALVHLRNIFCLPFRMMKEKVAQLRQQLELRKKRTTPSEPQGDEEMKTRADVKRQKQSALRSQHEQGEQVPGGTVVKARRPMKKPRILRM